MKSIAVQTTPNTLNGAHLPSSLSEKALAEESVNVKQDADNTQMIPDVELHRKKGQGVKTTDVQELPASGSANLPSSLSEKAFLGA